MLFGLGHIYLLQATKEKTMNLSCIVKTRVDPTTKEDLARITRDTGLNRAVLIREGIRRIVENPPAKKGTPGSQNETGG